MKGCPTKRDHASRISLNGPQAIAATFGQSSVPIYICEACFHDSGQFPKKFATKHVTEKSKNCTTILDNNWSPNINLQKPMTTVQLECENRNCSHEENAEVGSSLNLVQQTLCGITYAYTVHQKTHAKFTLFSLSKYGNSGNVPYRPPKLLRYCKPCMKSLKPNELHNYIYQSGPEDEAWKLPLGIVRLTVNVGQYQRTK